MSKMWNRKYSKYCQECGKELSKKYEYQKISTLGWVGIVFFMPVTWIVGAYLLTRDNARAHKDGKYMIILSVLLFIVVFIVKLFSLI